MQRHALNPERLNILLRAFEKAKYSGLHDNIHPLPVCLASELVGLITHQDISTSRHASQKIENPFSRMLPTHIITALVIKEKMASPPDYDPTLLECWSEQPKDKAFGAKCNTFSSKFTGFSICHPIYHGNTLYLTTRNAIYSAALSTEATATFVFLPSWEKRTTTNPYTLLYRRFPHII